MKEITLQSWDAFEALANEALINRYREGNISYSSQMLFRGQRRGEWALRTTLERIGKADYNCFQYDLDMQSAATAIETVTGKTWQFEKEEPEPDDNSLFRRVRNVGVMAWLRQNGFPSPLIDWSQSPYVASYFAFKDSDPDESDFVAIFTFVESETGRRSNLGNNPVIYTVGPWIPTDRKHFLQQSRYTVSRRRNGRTFDYAPHEHALQTSKGEQCRVVKYLIPQHERDYALRRLRVMNITEYSLFEEIPGLLSNISMDLFNL